MGFIRRCLMAAGYVLVFVGSAQSLTIGETAVLSIADGQNGNLLLAQSTKLAQAASIQSFSFYVTGASGNLILGMYDATGPNGGPGALKASTASFTPTTGWNTAKVLAPVSLAAGNYWLAYLPSSSNLTFVRNSAGSCAYYSYGFGSMPKNFSSSPASCTGTTWSLFATLAPVSTSSSPVNGACGSANGAAVSTAPTANLCSTGTASNAAGSGPWSWTCSGSNGGAAATCSATKVASAQPVNGACGSANGAAVSTAPTANLCSTGTASNAAGSGPWSWTCTGSNGGSAASCSDKLASTTTGTTPAGGLLPTVRDTSANWKMAGMLSVGGIPNRTTQCGTTIKPRGSGLDDTANIQNVINACPAGEVVLLAAGTFTVGEGNAISISSSVTLRGAGPGSTIVQRTNGCHALSPSSNGGCGSNPSPFVIVGPAQTIDVPWVSGNGVTSTNLTADAAQGASSVQVSSASGFSVGQMVLLDETSGAAWQPDVDFGGSSKVWAAPDFRVQWSKHQPSQNIDDFSSTTYPYTANGAGCWFSTPTAANGNNKRCDRPTSEIKKVSAISGNTITFDSPIMISYRVANTAQLSYYQYPFLSGAGVENITFSGSDRSTITFLSAVNSWAYRIECTTSQGQSDTYQEASCISLDQSLRIQMEQVYAHDAAFPDPATASYWISFTTGTSESLLTNSIILKANKLMASLQSGQGNVIAYNYMDQQEICCEGADNWIENGISNSHYAGAHHALLEGNFTSQMGGDDTHGNSTYNTYFRNYSTGYRLPSWVNAYDNKTINDLTKSPSAPGPLAAALVYPYNYWESFIGNVLGYPNYSTAVNGWTYLSTTGSPAIFSLGAQSNVPGVDPKSNLDINGGTTIAHGNYDYLTNAVAWDSNISSKTLPNSLYLRAKPAFFGAGSGYTWPWVNPTGAPQVYQTCAGGSRYCLPAKARYDAGTPFTQP